MQQFELAKSRYDAGNYAEAVERFAKLLDDGSAEYLTDPKLRRVARPFYAAALIALDRVDEADAVIAQTLRDDPSYSPTPGLFPQRVTDRFIAMRAHMRQELEDLARKRFEEERRLQLAKERARAAHEKWIAQMSELARQETVVSERSRFVATLPFGAGQFQNDDVELGWFFAVSEVLGAATSIASAAVAFNYGAVDCRTYVDEDTGLPADCQQLEQSYDTASWVNWISFGTTMALVAAGIIEAHASFEAESTTTREREVPPRPPVEPVVSWQEGGVMVGLHGHF